MTRKLDVYWHVRKAEGLGLVQSREEMAGWEYNKCSDTEMKVFLSQGCMLKRDNAQKLICRKFNLFITT